MANEQIALSFGKGITNVPSDATCDDNALEECMGMVFEDGEHRVVQKPKVVLTGVTGTLLYIHKTGTYERYILRNGSNITWAVKNGGTLGSQTTLLTESANLHVLQITSIGKTLILSTDHGIRYYLTKQDDYMELEDIPEPDVDFLLTDFHETDNGHGYDADPTTGEIGYIFDSLRFHTPYDSSQKSWNDFVIGQYSRNKKAAAKAYRFVNPFFVRVAVEMYDGTYSKISAPILMAPTLRYNSELRWENHEGYDNALIRTWSCVLKYKLNTSYENFSDLVKGVVVFVSDEVETQKTDSNIPPLIDFVNNSSRFDGNLLTISEQNNNGLNIRYTAPQEQVFYGLSEFRNRDICHYTDAALYDFYPVPIPRDESDIMKDLKDISVFFKIAELGRSVNTSWIDIKDVADPGGLENLKTKTSLNAKNSSDYFDHTKLQSNYTFVYNNRINLADVRRSLFAGFKSFMGYDNGLTPSTYKAFVTINTDQRDELVVMQEYTTTQKQGLWFYYPDTRAKHVKIYKSLSASSWYLILDADLTEHEGLNGAYYIGQLPFSDDYSEINPTTPYEIPPEDNDNNDFEELGNYIIASEINNPYIFKAEGYVQVGVGKVKAVSTITKAISQGQFGGFPLIAFSDNGVWALSISNTGIISTAKPMEREVVNANVQGITQSDDAVFFASRRGKLMAVVSTGNGVAVQSISEQLCGKQAEGQDLMTFLGTARIAYDYRDSLLWIFDGLSTKCWLYAINSGTFSKYQFGTGVVITNVVNNYPDYLLQSGSDVYSLLERPDINLDGNTVGNTFTPNVYTAKIVTRAMKFDNALALKSIRQIRNVSEMEGSVTYRLFASNDLKRWVELRALRGMPWKYYKMQFDFSDLKATDRFAGTVIVTQERRINKLR